MAEPASSGGGGRARREEEQAPWRPWEARSPRPRWKGSEFRGQEARLTEGTSQVGSKMWRHMAGTPCLLMQTLQLLRVESLPDTERLCRGTITKASG